MSFNGWLGWFEFSEIGVHGGACNWCGFKNRLLTQGGDVHQSVPLMYCFSQYLH